VLDLYARAFDGEPLGEDDYVLSADEKPGVQARSRMHPSRPPGPRRRPMRVESDYRRHARWPTRPESNRSLRWSTRS
jgi:hypothetical protein